MAIKSYELYRSGELQRRVTRAQEALKTCDLCPRNCGVNRLDGSLGVCATGRKARIASYGPHFGEEQPLTGKQGSGTIFFASCNVRCIFCQNHELSHFPDNYPEFSADQLADIMLEIQQKGCHNVNLVTPSHVVAPILEALVIAIERGLKIPIVYNSSGYEAPKTLELLDGVIDIYMPDFKFWNPESGQKYCNVDNYPDIAQQSLQLMHGQVGNLALDDHGIAVTGLLVRHLIMPDSTDETRNILEFISQSISPDTYINIMDQYSCPELGRSITTDEYRTALRFAKEAGLQRIDQRDFKRFLTKLGLI